MSKLEVTRKSKQEEKVLKENNVKWTELYGYCFLDALEKEVYMPLSGEQLKTALINKQ